MVASRWLALASIACVGFAGLLGASRDAAGQDASRGAHLTARDVRVSRAIVRSGSIIDVQAVVVNDGDEPAADVRIMLAVAGALPTDQSPNASRRWEAIEQDPAGPVATVPPGGKLEFRGRLRLDGEGAVQVGVAVASAGGDGVQTRGVPVRIVAPMATGEQVGVVFLSLVIAIGSTVVVGRSLWPSESSRRRHGSNWYCVATGGCTMIVGPLWLWTHHDWFTRPFAYGGVGLFALGWLLVGTGLWPRRGIWPGVLFAATAYGLAGVLWVTIHDIGLEGRSVASVVSPAGLPIALGWPFHIAQWIGIISPTVA